MTKDEVRFIIDRHRQLYEKSCSSSLVEMLLKLTKAVPINYYNEQAREQLKSTGLEHIANKTIAGITFRRFDQTNENGPLVDKIKSELNAGRFVGLYVRLSDYEVHGYVIAWIDGDYIQLLGKYSENGGGEGLNTDSPKIPLAFCHIIATDCIYYEEIPNVDSAH